jgi:hypothetical protein
MVEREGVASRIDLVAHKTVEVSLFWRRQNKTPDRMRIPCRKQLPLRSHGTLLE